MVTVEIIIYNISEACFRVEKEPKQNRNMSWEDVKLMVGRSAGADKMFACQ